MLSKRIVAIHAITKDRFSENHLVDYIKSMTRLGYSFISLDEILSNSCKGKKIALTIDDAYKCCVTNLLPILDKFNIKATLFVPNGLLGLDANDNRLLQNDCYSNQSMMSKDDLQCWVREGHEIGFHTYNHIDLYKTKNSDIEDDFRKGMNEMINDGFLIKYFAYPKGFLPKNRMFFEQLLREFHIQYAFTINWGGVNVKSPFYINRVCLGDREPLYWSVFKTVGMIDWYYLKQKIRNYERVWYN